MKNKKNISSVFNDVIDHHPASKKINVKQYKITLNSNYKESGKNIAEELAEISVITSYPPRECGIATYSQDLIKALNNKFSSSLSIKVCALEPGNKNYSYPNEVKYILNTSVVAEYEKLADSINSDTNIKIVLVQHEFGFFRHQEKAFYWDKQVFTFHKNVSAA